MKKSFLLPIALAVTAFLVLPLPGLSAPLSSRIQEKREQIERDKAKEGVLSSTIERFDTRIDAIQGEIAETERRLSRVQSSLDHQKEKLLEVRNKLEEARDRLERLRSELVTARRVLAARLVEIYKSDAPDALTGILSSDGFGDLLERAEFLDRISDQDREITDRVRGLKAEAHDQTVQLADLEEQEQLAAERILRERDQIAAVEDQLVGSRDQLASARADKRSALTQVRSSRVRAQEDLVALEREQARVQAALQGAGSPSAGPIKQGSGQLIWPVSGTLTSPFGMRWGRLHAGIDIAAPEGTPIRAADSGRVVIAGWTGGYGNYTCIQHTATMSTCYGHQVRLGTSTGASVTQGQVMGYVGNTGNSFGAHLHFEVRINGSPVDPMGYL